MIRISMFIILRMFSGMISLMKISQKLICIELHYEIHLFTFYCLLLHETLKSIIDSNMIVLKT
jgi:hypothetical protein